MVLVDTSCWVDHLRHGSSRLSALLLDNQVCMHPWVIGELACGSLSRRAEVLGYLKALPTLPVVADDEVLRFIAQHGLHGRGLGWVDIALLASSQKAGVQLWSLDRRLALAAQALQKH